MYQGPRYQNLKYRKRLASILKMYNISRPEETAEQRSQRITEQLTPEFLPKDNDRTAMER